MDNNRPLPIPLNFTKIEKNINMNTTPYRNNSISNSTPNFILSHSKKNTPFTHNKFNFSIQKDNPNFAKIQFTFENSNMTPIRPKTTKKAITPKKHKNSDKRKFTVREKLNSLKRVCEFLERFFKGEIVYFEEYNFEAHELSLVKLIVEVSFYKVFRHYKPTKKAKKQAQVSNIKNYLKEFDLFNLSSKILKDDFFLVKRKEENLKFVMKNTLKYFRKEFFKSNGLKTCLESEKQFLNYFFKEQRDKFNMPVEAFSDPLNKKNLKNPSFKTLSNNYLAHVFSIDKFQKIFFVFLEINFKKYYQKKIYKKLRKMLKPLKLKLEEGEMDKQKEMYEEFLKELKKKKIWKLPWFDKEIDNAIFIFKKHINNILCLEDVI